MAFRNSNECTWNCCIWNYPILQIQKSNCHFAKGVLTSLLFHVHDFRIWICMRRLVQQLMILWITCKLFFGWVWMKWRTLYIHPRILINESQIDRDLQLSRTTVRFKNNSWCERKLCGVSSTKTWTNWKIISNKYIHIDCCRLITVVSAFLFSLTCLPELVHINVLCPYP